MGRARAREAHSVPERPPIRVAAGDVVLVGERDTKWPAFVFVTTSDGAGWVPDRYLSRDGTSAVVIVRYDTTELPTETGVVLDVLVQDDESGWWWCRAPDGAEGWVPVATLESLPA
jgi:hypothetical protein